MIRDGIISSEQLVEACLARIREVDPQVEAWAFLDPDHALAQARAADELRLSGQPIGALHGVPVAIKDIFDTADMPTEYGSPIYAGRTPSRDATVVSLLRAAGAVIMGKTVTTEFAYFSPGKTRNPHNPEHTPGGSSSGSAAAVGAEHGAARDRQPDQRLDDSPCGVLRRRWFQTDPWADFAPSRTRRLSRTLDHVGLFARSVDDIALLAEQIVGYDENDPDTRPRARIPFVNVARRRAAAAADVCVHQDADMGTRRRGYQRRICGS